MIGLYHIRMFRSLMIVMLALAVAALPFGMGAMMAAQAGSNDAHWAMIERDAVHSGHAAHALHGLPQARHGATSDDIQGHASPSNGGAHIHFAACGSCASLPPIAGYAPPMPAGEGLPHVLAPAPLHSLDTLPVLPPPRG
jgi:hypothetical protein